MYFKIVCNVWSSNCYKHAFVLEIIIITNYILLLER